MTMSPDHPHDDPGFFVSDVCVLLTTTIVDTVDGPCSLLDAEHDERQPLNSQIARSGRIVGAARGQRSME